MRERLLGLPSALPTSLFIQFKVVNVVVQIGNEVAPSDEPNPLPCATKPTILCELISLSQPYDLDASDTTMRIGRSRPVIRLLG